MCSIVYCSKQTWKRINYETHPHGSISSGMILYNFCWGKALEGQVEDTFSHSVQIYDPNHIHLLLIFQ